MIANQIVRACDDSTVTMSVDRNLATISTESSTFKVFGYEPREFPGVRRPGDRFDFEVDALEDAVFRDLLTFMMEDPRNISFCTHLLFCSKNLERIGDHATNIAEMVHYLVTGQSLPVDRPRGGAEAPITKVA